MIISQIEVGINNKSKQFLETTSSTHDGHLKGLMVLITGKESHVLKYEIHLYNTL